MFNTIILALDGSERSGGAVRAVRQVAGPSSHIIAIHLKTHATELEHEILISRQLDDLQSAGLAVEFEPGTTVTGDEANVIARAARRHEADVIVAASQGYAPLRGVLVGSVTQRLLHLATCPVLVVPPARDA